MPTRKVIYPVSMNTYLIFDSIPTLDIGVVQHRAVTEVAPKSPYRALVWTEALSGYCMLSSRLKTYPAKPYQITCFTPLHFSPSVLQSPLIIGLIR